MELGILPDEESQHGTGSFDQSAEMTPAAQRNSRRSGGSAASGQAGRAGDDSDASFLGDDSLLADDSLYKSMRTARASSPPRAHNDRGEPGEPKWADIESPFDRARREIQEKMAAQNREDHSAREASATQTRRTAGNDLARGIANLGVSARGKGDPDESSSDIATPPQITSRARPSLRDTLLRGKVAATPKSGSKHAGRNPFAPESGRQAADAATPRDAAKWNGIADLRKTPLSTAHERGSRDAAGADSTLGSMVSHGLDRSPPVTMQFSIPRSKYLQTPAKEAARMVVDDLLRTAGGSRISPRTAFKQRQAAASAQASGASSRAGVAGAPAVRSAILGTPLKLDAKKDRNRRRESMPTPPTVTSKVIPEMLEDTPGSVGAGGAVEAGSLLESGGSRAASGRAASSMLMDEGEEVSLRCFPDFHLALTLISILFFCP